MRDPDRIKKILTLVQNAWEAHPDLRLGQLLQNVTGVSGSLWNVEDDVLLDDLIEWLDSSKNWTSR